MTTATRSPAKTSLTIGYGDYLRFSRMVDELYGLNFPEKRRADLEQGIRVAFASSACEDLDSYYTLLLDPTNSYIHRQQLVNALTIGESHFFRDAGQFDALYTQVLPDIIERRRPLRTLRIWSAGCAEGQEPYSLAMMLQELLPDASEWAITILGTDINTTALERAHRGIYSDWAFRESRAHAFRERYFRDLGGKRYELLPHIRQMVSFAQLNLAEDTYPAFKTNTTYLDLILCRNVTIYLSSELTHKVVERFYDGLVDGGWLVVGHSEHSAVTYRQFQAHSFPDAILYQRTGCPTKLPDDWDWLIPTPAESNATPFSVPEPHAARTPSSKAAPPAPEGTWPETGTPTISATGTPVSGASIQGTPPAASPAGGAAATGTRPEGPDPLAHAGELLEYGHAEQARDLLMTVLDLDPQNRRAAVLLGQAYANLGAWQEAQTWCQRAIQMANLEPEPYYILALVLQHQGRLNEALATMRKAVYLDSSSIRGQYGLANLHHSLRQLPQALKALDNARRLLMAYTNSDVLPQTGGITAGVMRQAITQQFQQWSAEAIGVKNSSTSPPDQTR